jgi:hypothetical protein
VKILLHQLGGEHNFENIYKCCKLSLSQQHSPSSSNSPSQQPNRRQSGTNCGRNVQLISSQLPEDLVQWKGNTDANFWLDVRMVKGQAAASTYSDVSKRKPPQV